MKLTSLGVSIIVTGLLSGFPAPVLAQSETVVSVEDAWFQDGERALSQRVGHIRNRGRAKNIILFIGDGMGISTITAARIYDGQLRGETGEENSLVFEDFPDVSLVKTYNTNQQVPDSAGTATAMYTGVKTKAGVLAVSSAVRRRDCASSQGTALTTMAEYAERSGKATGVVSTARITHATPAALYAHSPERNWERDSELTEEAKVNGCKDNARQLIDYDAGDGFEVILGGGSENFFGANFGGKRSDPNADLPAEWIKGSSLKRTFVQNASELAAVAPGDVDQIFGLFSKSHMTYTRDKGPENDEPTLAEMTSKAIDLLAKDDDGYFLMVEAGRIDHAHHDNIAEKALIETLDLNTAIQAALSKVDLNETLVLVTADHSHVFTISGYPTRGNPILGLVVSNDHNGEPEKSPKIALDGQPYTTLSYSSGHGMGEGPRRHPFDGAEEGKPLIQQSLVATGSMKASGLDHSETHAGEDVALFATGPQSHLVSGVMEQNVIFHIMAHAFGWELE